MYTCILLPCVIITAKFLLSPGPPTNDSGRAETTRDSQGSIGSCKIPMFWDKNITHELLSVYLVNLCRCVFKCNLIR